MTYKVEVKGKPFSAAHSDSMVGGEPLHGHSFAPTVIAEGEKLGKSGMLVCFRKVKKELNEITEEFDHKVLLGKKDVKEIKGGFIHCEAGYVIPNSHAVILDADFVMCEALAKAIYLKLKPKLPKLEKLEVKVQETDYGAASFSE